MANTKGKLPALLHNTMRIGRSLRNPRVPRGITFLVGFFAFVMIAVVVNFFQEMGYRTTSTGSYMGTQYWNDRGATLEVMDLYETKFARFQVHKVLLEGGKTVVDDWMWMDECDNVNVLIQNGKGNYLVFEQRKYGIKGLTYAVLGGLIDPGEDPLTAAQRELKEELQMISTEWVSLGAYRAMANRGGGTTHTFLARHTHPIVTSEPAIMNKKKEFSEGESERQEVLELSKKELIEALLAGKFKEIKWTATAALALLKQEYQ
jgi:ADP-ribose pyrophosphatase